MKHILKAFCSRDAMLAEKEKLIKKFSENKTLSSYSDTTVSTKTVIYIFDVVKIDFPLPILSNYPFESVECDDVIARLDEIKEKILSVGNGIITNGKIESDVVKPGIVTQAVNQPTSINTQTNG